MTCTEEACANIRTPHHGECSDLQNGHVCRVATANSKKCKPEVSDLMSMSSWAMLSQGAISGCNNAMTASQGNFLDAKDSARTDGQSLCFHSFVLPNNAYKCKQSSSCKSKKNLPSCKSSAHCYHGRPQLSKILRMGVFRLSQHALTLSIWRLQPAHDALTEDCALVGGNQ